jgi:hypothetical protein
MQEKRESANSKSGTSNPQISAKRGFPPVRAFSKMTGKQQAKFIQKKFAAMDPAELVSVVRAIYGHPHDKGRPRRDSASTHVARSSASLACNFAKATVIGYRCSQSAG